MNEKILIAPGEIVVPAKSSREVTVVITNNFPYPVFMVGLVIEVTSGKVKLEDLIINHLSGPGLIGKRYIQQNIDKINARTPYEFSITIHNGRHEEPATIKLTVEAYAKDPAGNFWMEGVKEMPKTISIPPGLIPKMYKNEPKR